MVDGMMPKKNGTNETKSSKPVRTLTLTHIHSHTKVMHSHTHIHILGKIAEMGKEK